MTARVRRAVAAGAACALAPSASPAHPPAYELLGMPYYSMGFIEGFAQLVALAAFLSGLVIHRRRAPWPRLRASALLTLGTVLAWEAACHADVLYISWRAHRLCASQGGLHVYRTATADGVLGVSGIEYWSAYGFDYLEKRVPGRHGEPGILRRMMRDGEPAYVWAEDSRSRYAFVGGVMVPVSYGLARRRDRVEARDTGEVLGELIAIGIGPGWFDRLVLSLLPGARRPWTCGEAAPPESGRYSAAHGVRLYDYSDLIKATLKPRARAKDDS